MAKIIKLNGEEILIGTDDGKIRSVSINDVRFVPTEGDEVEIFESDGQIVVTKKEIHITNVDNYVNQNQENDIVRVFIYISNILSIIACFLPLISVSFLGVSYSINYVYNEGKVADGIIVIIIQLLSIMALSRKKKKAVCVYEWLSICIFGFTAYNMFNSFSNSTGISIYSFLGIGFYILAISLIISAILATIRASKK